MIGGFKHKGLEELFNSGKTRRIRPDQLKKCARIVQLLDLATRPEEMNIVGLHFHGLQGQPRRWSVRVTANYRITFAWSGEEALEIELEDYH